MSIFGSDVGRNFSTCCQGAFFLRQPCVDTAFLYLSWASVSVALLFPRGHSTLPMISRSCACLHWRKACQKDSVSSRLFMDKLLGTCMPWAWHCGHAPQRAGCAAKARASAEKPAQCPHQPAKNPAKKYSPIKLSPQSTPKGNK